MPSIWYQFRRAAVGAAVGPESYPVIYSRLRWSRKWWKERRKMVAGNWTLQGARTTGRAAGARYTPGLPRWASTRKVKPIWILLKQETVSGCGISWAICKSAPRSRQITTPAPHHSDFYRPDALPAAQPTALKHWMRTLHTIVNSSFCVYEKN